LRPDYCPIGGEPCQSLCEKPCKVIRRKPISDFDAADAFTTEPHTDDVFAAYQQGIRFAEHAHGIVEPARGDALAYGQMNQTSEGGPDA